MAEGVLESIKSKNFYEILNVGTEATSDQIRDSYKEIAKLYHPDSNFYSEIIQDPLSAEEQECFKLITDAYNTLMNPEKRTNYDKIIPKGLKAWDDGEESSEKIERPRPPTKIFTDASIRTPGTIDLSRFQNIQKPTIPEPPLPEPPQHNITMILPLFVGLGLAFGMCVSVLILIFSKAH